MRLILAIKEGDHQAFMCLYQHWDKRVYHYFLKKAKSPDLAQELTQITFIKIWEYRTLLSLDYSFEVQLFHRARMVLIDWLRKAANERKLYDGIERLQTGRPNTNKNTNTDFELNDQVKHALGSLPPMRKKVFELNRIHGFSYKEIASHLSISIKTVDNHLSQAIKQLKRLLSPAIILVVILSGDKILSIF